MIRGALGTIGFVWPDDGLNDDEYWSYLPDGVAWLTSRFAGTLEGHGLDRAVFEASAELGPMSGAARLLARARPDVVALGDHGGSFVLGKGHDITQAKALARASGAPHGTTAATALVAALLSLGVRRKISVVSPYDEEMTSLGVAFMEAHGFTVLTVERRSLGDEHGIAGQLAGFWGEASAVADHLDAEAVVLFGGGLRTAGMLAAIEARLGKPVVPATAALVWHACKLMGIEVVRPGMGSLFEVRNRPSEGLELQRALHEHLSTGTKTLSVSDTPPLFGSGAGSWLRAVDGKTYLDFACGSGTTVLGHNHPAIAAALRTQLDTGVTHLGPHFLAPVQVALIRRLVELLPRELSIVHPATNGTEATETALKAAMHATGRRRFIAFEGSYHGRTLGALSVSHARGSNASLGDLLPATVFVPYPKTEAATVALEALLRTELTRGDYAGLIVEPVQATAGMEVPHPSLMPMLRRLTRQYDVPLIVDEVFTGYGRTGTLFAFEAYGIVPDLLILAKAASGGVPGALVIGTRAMLQSWSPGTQSSTFQLSPLSAAASLSTLETILADDLCTRATRIGDRLRQRLEQLSPGRNVSGIGAMIGLTILDKLGKPDQPLAKRIRALALTEGLLTWECGSEGHVIGLVPPLTVTDDEIDRGVEMLAHAASVAARAV